MEIQITDATCVVILLQNTPDAAACEGLVCAALMARALPLWSAAEIHLHPGKSGCLLIAFPTAPLCTVPPFPGSDNCRQ